MYTTRKIRFQHRLFIFISILSAVMAQIKTDRNQSNVIFHNALVRYASVFGFIRIHNRNRRPGDRIFHFFLWNGRVTQRGLTKQFCNPSPLCANWQSPPEEFHNNFDDIYSGFFLFFFLLSLFFPSCVRMKRLKAKCWNYRDLGTKKFDGEECCETSRGVDSSRAEWSTRLLHLREDCERSVAKWRTHPCSNWTFSRLMNRDWEKLISLTK